MREMLSHTVFQEIYITLNMSNDSAYEVNADEGDTLRPLGYIDSDFIYGMAHKDDIISGADGSRTYAMYRVGIIDVDYNLIKEYEQPDIYVSSTEVQGKRITLSRIVKSGSGYVSTSIDQLINKDENVIQSLNLRMIFHGMEDIMCMVMESSREAEHSWSQQ